LRTWFWEIYGDDGWMTCKLAELMVDAAAVSMTESSVVVPLLPVNGSTPPVTDLVQVSTPIDSSVMNGSNQTTGMDGSEHASVFTNVADCVSMPKNSSNDTSLMNGLGHRSSSKNSAHLLSTPVMHNSGQNSASTPRSLRNRSHEINTSDSKRKLHCRNYRGCS